MADRPASVDPLGGITKKGAEHMGQAMRLDMAGVWKIGDHVGPGAASRRSLTVPGRGGWFALTCRPQSEGAVEAWLALRGVYAFHPVVRRRVRVRGHVRRYERRYLPGYVFARFPAAPCPLSVLSCPMLTGAVCLSSGRWARLDGARLRALHAMRAADADLRASAAQDRARRKAAARLRQGDAALFHDGPMAGQRCEVISITASGGAVVELTLFGGPTRVEAAPGSLVRMKSPD